MESKSIAYSVMSTFVFTTTTSYILTKFQDLQYVTTENGVYTEFRHPIFQANTGFILEFAIMWGILWPFINFTKPAPRKLFDYKTGFFEFLAPASLDWMDKIFLTMGTSQTSASMPTMVRGLVPPIAGYMSYLLFNTHFSIYKMMALVISIIGVAMGCFV
jgi:drug/metabolite transporter (DMT)-like permease